MVLGVDPGFAAFGLAAVELVEAGLRPVAAWVERTEPSARKRAVRASEDNVRRAQELAAALERAVARFAPVAVAAETMSWPRDAGAATKVALAWGVLVAAAHRHGLPLVQASPQEVKRALVGRKSAGKAEIVAEIERRWPELELPAQATLQEHAADAVAVVVACQTSEVLQMARRLSARAGGAA
jgi:crossover junction endodeoxyribonuclease RuvC